MLPAALAGAAWKESSRSSCTDSSSLTAPRATPTWPAPGTTRALLIAYRPGRSLPCGQLGACRHSWPTALPSSGEGWSATSNWPAKSTRNQWPHRGRRRKGIRLPCWACSPSSSPRRGESWSKPPLLKSTFTPLQARAQHFAV
eukprot:2702235-Alexandrium_andersonii.AAC.1